MNLTSELQRGMLAQLAARLRARQGVGGDGGPGGVVVGEDGETIMIDDNCMVGSRFYFGIESNLLIEC